MKPAGLEAYEANPFLVKSVRNPVVRTQKAATVGYKPTVHNKRHVPQPFCGKQTSLQHTWMSAQATKCIWAMKEATGISLFQHRHLPPFHFVPFALLMQDAQEKQQQ